MEETLPEGVLRSVQTRTITAAIGGRPVSATITGDVEANDDASLTAFLYSAMRSGEEITVESASPRLLEGAEMVQEIVTQWWPQQLQRVKIIAEPVERSPGGNGVACFFSGGVDSFYTILGRLDEITHLVFLRGFDIRLDKPLLLDQAAAAARDAANALGKPLLEITTDLRTVATVNWESDHGPVLATIGHMIGHTADRVLIPASHTYNDLFPWGSHPLLDRLWSSERVEFHHVGAGATRYAKLQAIAHHPVVLEHLRVCWINADGLYNCGRCEKCVRTMIQLHIAGTLGQCKTLPSDLDYTRVCRMHLRNPSDVSFADENIAGAEAAGDRRLVAAIRFAKRRSTAYNATAGRIPRRGR